MLRYFCFLFYIFLAACNNPNEHINKQLKDRYERKTDLMSLKYINSDFSFIEDLYREDFIFNNDRLFIYFVDPNDCSTCIYDGFDVIDQIELIEGGNFIYTLTWDNRFDRSLIVVDSNYTSMHLLSSAYSPAFFILNRNLMVENIFLIDGNINSSTKSAFRFISSAIKK